jgi:cyclic pyranopterin phosphate synthase
MHAEEAKGRPQELAESKGSPGVADALPVDLHGRPLRVLRVSLTDRCNLRCEYCMPEDEYAWLPRADLLSFDEIARLVDAFTDAGVTKVRLTGGEPLLRPDVPDLVRRLSSNARIEEIALTSNGVLLAEHAAALRAAGLNRITVSLDTLRPDRFARLARSDQHARVLAGIESAQRELGSVKLDTVVIRGVNDDEVADLLDFGRQLGAEVRFIEYMDVGGATRWSPDRVVSRGALLEIIERRFGRATRLPDRASAPAERFALADGTRFGVIASVTTPFCGACDRSRLTADGMWFLCLYAESGEDLRTPLRDGRSRAELAGHITAGWQRRADRGAEERTSLPSRGLLPVESLRRNPHLEMHTRGG